MRRLAALALATLAVTAPGPVPATQEEPSSLRLRDRIVAVVDDDPILLSDLERVVALGLAEPREGESPAAFRRRVLDDLVAQRLRHHEVERYGLGRTSVEAVEAQLAKLRARWPDDADWQRRLRELGMTEEAVEQLLTRQIEVMTYVDELLGARVFVGLEEIETYYESELSPRLREMGEPVPPLAEIREQIRQVVRERRLNEELERWTEELRREADVIDLLERPERSLPPVVAAAPAPADPD